MKKFGNVPLCLFFMIFSSSCGFDGKISNQQPLAAQQTNKFKMSILTMLQFNPETKQTIWPACDTAVQFVIDHVNSRRDILPQYNLIIQHGDQGPNAVLSNYAIVNYLRDHDGDGTGADTFVSPVVFGPTKSCQTSGLTIRSLGLTTISPQCAGPFIVERKGLYSTLYSAMAPANLQAWSMLKFIKHVGQWNEIAIVTNRNNPNEYKRAEFLADIAVQHDVDVLFYSNEYQFTMETMENLKQSHARIIGVVINQRPLCLQFLCMAYKAGVRAPLYVFVFATYNCMITDISSQNLPDGCTMEMIEQQTMAMISAGTYGGWTGTDDFTTSFGYSYDQFKYGFEKLANGKQLPDSGSTELMCHDTAMALVLTLNASEQVLQQNYNLTLRDWSEYPEIVGNVVNHTASKVNFQGLRINHFKYNAKGELDEDKWIGQSLKGKSLRMLYRVRYIGPNNLTLAERSLDHFELEMQNEIVWYTKSRKQPKDLSQMQIRAPTCSIAFPITVGILAGISLLVHILLAVLKQQPASAFPNMIPTVAIRCGCLILTVSSLVHSVGSIYFANLECRIRQFPTFLALACLFPTFAVKLGSYVKVGILYHLNRLQVQSAETINENSRISVKTTGFNAKVLTSRASRQPRRKRFIKYRANLVKDRNRQLKGSIFEEVDEVKIKRQLNKSISIAISILVPLLVVLVIVWTIAFPFSRQFEFSDPNYDDDLDVYYQQRHETCHGPHELAWTLTFVIAFTLMMFSSVISIGRVKKTGLDERFRSWHSRLSMAAINLGTVFFSCCFITVLLWSSKAKLCLIANVIALSEIFIAITTQLLVMAPPFNK